MSTRKSSNTKMPAVEPAAVVLETTKVELPPGYSTGAAISGGVIYAATGIGAGLAWLGKHAWGFAKGVARTDVHPAS